MPEPERNVSAPSTSPDPASAGETTGDLVASERLLDLIASIVSGPDADADPLRALERVRGILPPAVPWATRTDLTRLTLKTLDLPGGNNGYPELNKRS